MVAVQPERLPASAPTARALQFTHDPGVSAQGWKPVAERLTITPGITPAAPVPLATASIDRFLSDVARHFGHDPRHLVGATIRVQLRAAWADAPERAAPLTVTVRRERRGPGFTARASISRAFGSGATIGEAFVDCVVDFLDRADVLEAEQDRLGPGPQAEREDIRRWLGSAP